MDFWSTLCAGAEAKGLRWFGENLERNQLPAMQVQILFVTFNALRS
jgi:hypothetical protein